MKPQNPNETTTTTKHRSNQSIRDLTLGFLLNESDKKTISGLSASCSFPRVVHSGPSWETLRHLSAETETAVTSELVP